MFVNQSRNGDFVQASSAVQLTNNAGMLGWSKHPVQKQFSARNVDLVYASIAQMIVSNCRIGDLVPASSAEMVVWLSIVNPFRNGDFVLGIQCRSYCQQCRNGDFVLSIQCRIIVLNQCRNDEFVKASSAEMVNLFKHPVLKLSPIAEMVNICRECSRPVQKKLSASVDIVKFSRHPVHDGY